MAIYGVSISITCIKKKTFILRLTFFADIVASQRKENRELKTRLAVVCSGINVKIGEKIKGKTSKWLVFNYKIHEFSLTKRNHNSSEM